MNSVRLIAIFLVCLQIEVSNADAIAEQTSASKTHLIEDQRNDIVGIEYVLVEPTDAKIYSRWGHSFLILRNPKIPIAKNIVVEFQALVEEKNISYLQAVTTGYPFNVNTSTFEFKSIVDVTISSRDLSRFILTMTPLDLKKLLDNLIELEHHPEKLSSYNFFTNNCASAISKIFLKNNVIESKTILPARIGSLVWASGVSPFPKMKIAGRKKKLTEIERALNWPQGTLGPNTQFRLADFEGIHNKFGIRFLAQLYYENSPFNSNSKALLFEYMRPYLDDLTLSDVQELASPPAELYFLGQTESEYEKINEKKFEFFNYESLFTDIEYLQAAWQGQISSGLVRSSNINRILLEPKIIAVTLIEKLALSDGSRAPELSLQGRALFANFSDLSPENNGDWSQNQYILAGHVQPSGDLIFTNLKCKRSIGQTLHYENCRIFVKSENNNLSLVLIGFNLPEKFLKIK